MKIHEIIIKVINVDDGRRDTISQAVNCILLELGAELKIASKEDNYSNEIYQIGEQEKIDLFV